MKLDPEPTAVEIRLSRIYCVICAVAALIPAALAFQLVGPLSWQFILLAAVVLAFLLAALLFPARASVFFARFIG